MLCRRFLWCCATCLHSQSSTCVETSCRPCPLMLEACTGEWKHPAGRKVVSEGIKGCHGDRFTVSSLRTLLLDGNVLSCLPAELGSLEGLTYLGLSFNRFSRVPPVLEKLRALEKLCLAGNQLSVLDVAGLTWLSARHIDLR